MLLTEMQEKMLRQLLDQFTPTEDIRFTDLTAVYAYLFKKDGMIPFFKDEELFETIRYLREIVTTLHIAGLEELTAYYSDKKKSIAARLSEMTEMPHSEMPPQWADLIEENQAQAGTDLTCINTYDLMARYLRAVRDDNRLGTTVLHLTARSSADRISRTYLEQFCLPHLGKLVFIMGFFDKVGKKDRAQQQPVFGRTRTDYNSIIAVLRRELPIRDNNFKLRLAAWMMDSKVRTCRYQPVLAGNSGSLPAAPAYFFECRDEDGGSLYHEDIPHHVITLFQSKLCVKKWVILKRPEGQFWLTSDDPGFVIDPSLPKNRWEYLRHRRSLSEIHADSVFYYPLSKDYCLRVQPDEPRPRTPVEGVRPIEFMQCSTEEIDRVNEMTVSTRREIVIASEERMLSKYQHL